MSLNIKARRKALGLTREDMAGLIGLRGTCIIAEIEKDEVPGCYKMHLEAADSILERLEDNKETGMIDGMTVRLARIRKGLSQGALGSMIHMGGGSLSRLEAYNRCNLTTLTKVLNALGMEGQETKFRELKMPMLAGKARLHTLKYISKHSRPDTTAADEAEARLLNISYGTYMAYKQTGYLETYKHQAEAFKARDEGANVIQSHIGAGLAGSRRPQSVGGSRVG